MTLISFDKCSGQMKKHLNKAREVAGESDMYHKVGSVLTSDGKCIASACNSSRSQFGHTRNGKTHCSCHAEQGAFMGLRGVHEWPEKN